MKTKVSTILKWTARISNALILSFVLFFLLAHIIGDQEDHGGAMSQSDMVLFTFFPILTIVGLALAWKWELVGGAISFLSIVLGLSVTSLIFFHKVGFIDDPQFLLIAMPGFLHVCHALMERRSLS